jgi:hypothetical protein
MTDQQGNSINDLMKQLSIRDGLREKLLYLYGSTFADIFAILESAEEFDFYILMHSTDEIMDAQPKTDTVIIHTHSEIAFNTQIILQEILDDYWAAYLCFQNGFTKQCQEIFRNTLELIVQMYYLRYLKRIGSQELDEWVSGVRGIENVAQKIKAIKSTPPLQRDCLHTRLNQMYDRLCTATHSHKQRMTSLKMPRMMWARYMPSFEPSEILYTKGLFLSLLDLELQLIRDFLEDGVQTEWTPKLINILDKMLDKLKKYTRTISIFEKGYIVHREYAKIDDTQQILYSVRLDGKIEYPSRRKVKLTEQQLKLLRNHIQNRLVQDSQ